MQLQIYNCGTDSQKNVNCGGGWLKKLIECCTESRLSQGVEDCKIPERGNFDVKLGSTEG